ncbi:hypothetical protein P3T24_000612 [Paraburkholderia sp. GAS33]|jgi:hypothetical protein|uniref:hypothetical protein n=1 Tax=Paraburkholderia sp. GAS33 TaxID=3035130 RepID=UPI003D1D0534
MPLLSKIPGLFAKSTDVDMTLTRAGRSSLTASIVWAFFELPFELSSAQTSTATALLLMETLLSACVALLTLQGVAWARLVFLFLCGTTIMVIASDLATETAFYPVWSTLSLIELITKVGSFILVTRSGSRST